jgi:galactose-1-phosphate uridylyltransferase
MGIEHSIEVNKPPFTEDLRKRRFHPINVIWKYQYPPVNYYSEHIIVCIAMGCHCERSEAILSDCHACVPERLLAAARHFGVQARR